MGLKDDYNKQQLFGKNHMQVGSDQNPDGLYKT